MIQNAAELREVALSPFRQDPGNGLPVTSSAASLMLTGNAMERMFTFAEWMAKGRVAVPAHLLGNTSDCLAVVMQAMQWDMNPFAVAQKTYLAKDGKLGYEAQLISAVVATSPLADGLPSYEFIGDWSKVLGKFEKRQSTKQGGGDYLAATYKPADEVGLGVICRMKIKGEAAPRELTVMLVQCQPRFSTQWATDPKQQITYVAIRKWARQNTPGVILGVYGEDEFEQSAPAAAPAAPRDMGAAEIVQPQRIEAPASLAEDHPVVAAGFAAARISRDEFDKWWAGVNAELRPAVHPHIAAMRAAGKAAYEARMAAAEQLAQAATKEAASTSSAGAPAVTYAAIMADLNAAHAARNIEALGVAADLIGTLQDKAHRDELEAMFISLNGELMAAA